MSTHLSGGSLGFAAAPVLFAPFIAYMGLQWSPLIMIPGLLALSWTLRQVPEMSLPHAHERSTLATLRPAAVPLTLLYFTIVLRTATTYGFMTFTPTLLTQQGYSIGEASTAVSLYLFSSGIGGFFGGPLADRVGARRVILWTLIAVGAVHGGRAAPAAARLHGDAGDRRTAAAIDAADQRHLRAELRQRRRGHGVVADDGICLGHGQPDRAAHRHGRGSIRHPPTLAVVAFIPLLAAGPGVAVTRAGHASRRARRSIPCREPGPGSRLPDPVLRSDPWHGTPPASAIRSAPAA